MKTHARVVVVGGGIVGVVFPLRCLLARFMITASTSIQNWKR